jgi:hypothetical protein
MVLSEKTYETILDLIENKMSCMEGWDQATSRERAKLEACRRELVDLNEPNGRPADAAVHTSAGHQA